jgi:NtrC-family two-component system sensor histidine kinase KinB
MRLLKYLNKRSDTFLVVLGFIFILVLGVIDYLTGSEISFSIFYLLPISLIIWLVGRRAGITMSVASTISWLTADLLAGQTYSYCAIPYWNAIMRLGFFIIVTLALSGLKASRNRQDELGQFIVHDLRSPLSNIIMGLQTLQEIADTNLDDAEIDLIQTCLVSCNRMLTLINSILDLSRLEDGHMPLQVSEVNVKELVESSIKQVTVWADHNQVNLQYDLAVGVEKVNTDYELTMRVLVNLLSNAIKFSKPQSSVIVRVATLDVDMLTFSVIDQGPGIPREWEDKIFDKFIQVETHKAGGKKSGSGLGLTFSRLAVETLGGHIWIESNLDLGTTISFTLPIRACANSTQ